MLRYNTQLERLKLPEYGRNIQNMVEHCLTLTDRDERNACARSIIEAMIRLTPQAKNDPDHTRKLWDHLAIISDFRLDIDYPFDQVEKDTLQSTPERVAYGLQNIRSRRDETSRIQGRTTAYRQETTQTLILPYPQKQTT